MKLFAMIFLLSAFAQAAPAPSPFEKYMDRFHYFQLRKIFPEVTSAAPTSDEALAAASLGLAVERATSDYRTLVEEINREGAVSEQVRREIVLRQGNQLGSLMRVAPENLNAEDKTRFINNFYLLLIASDGSISTRLSTQFNDLVPPGERLEDVQRRQIETSRIVYGLGLNALFLGGIVEFFAGLAYGAPLHLAGDLHLTGAALAAATFYKMTKLSNGQVFAAVDKVTYLLWRNPDLKLAIKKAASLATDGTLSDAEQVRWFFGYFESFYTQQIRGAKVTVNHENIIIDCSKALEI